MEEGKLPEGKSPEGENPALKPPAPARLWTLRHLEDTEREKSACGYRHRLLTSGDGTSAFAHLVRIYDAKPHFHRRTTELYYAVEGSGTMTLDGEEVPLRPGTCLELKPGVVHSARGDVLVLVVGIPSISDEDTFFPPSGEARNPDSSSAAGGAVHAAGRPGPLAGGPDCPSGGSGRSDAGSECPTGGSDRPTGRSMGDADGPTRGIGRPGGPGTEWP